MGLEYDAHLINIMKNDQFTPEFIAVNPNSKIPAIVDPDGPGELVMFCASPMLCFFHIVCFFGSAWIDVVVTQFVIDIIGENLSQMGNCSICSKSAASFFPNTNFSFFTLGANFWIHSHVICYSICDKLLGGKLADGKPFSVFESGAILLYLADKTGKFLSHDPRLKWETIQWLFFEMAGVGPMFGQVKN
jgi:hypothetical protein